MLLEIRGFQTRVLMEPSFLTKAHVEAQCSHLGVKATAALPLLGRLCRLASPSVLCRSPTGSTQRTQTFHFWCLAGCCLAFLPSSLWALFHRELFRVQLPGPVGKTAWPGALLPRLGTALWSSAALSQHRAHLARARTRALPEAPSSHSSPVLPCPQPDPRGLLGMASPWVEETEYIFLFLSHPLAPVPPASTSREAFPRLPERHLSL